MIPSSCSSLELPLKEYCEKSPEIITQIEELIHQPRKIYFLAGDQRSLVEFSIDRLISFVFAKAQEAQIVLRSCVVGGALLQLLLPIRINSEKTEIDPLLTSDDIDISFHALTPVGDWGRQIKTILMLFFQSQYKGQANIESLLDRELVHMPFHPDNNRKLPAHTELVKIANLIDVTLVNDAYLFSSPQGRPFYVSTQTVDSIHLNMETRSLFMVQGNRLATKEKLVESLELLKQRCNIFFIEGVREKQFRSALFRFLFMINKGFIQEAFGSTLLEILTNEPIRAGDVSTRLRAHYGGAFVPKFTSLLNFLHIASLVNDPVIATNVVQFVKDWKLQYFGPEKMPLFYFMGILEANPHRVKEIFNLLIGWLVWQGNLDQLVVFKRPNLIEVIYESQPHKAKAIYFQQVSQEQWKQSWETLSKENILKAFHECALELSQKTLIHLTLSEVNCLLEEKDLSKQGMIESLIRHQALADRIDVERSFLLFKKLSKPYQCKEQTLLAILKICIQIPNKQLREIQELVLHLIFTIPHFEILKPLLAKLQPENLPKILIKLIRRVDVAAQAEIVQDLVRKKDCVFNLSQIPFEILEPHLGDDLSKRIFLMSLDCLNPDQRVINLIDSLGKRFLHPLWIDEKNVNKIWGYAKDHLTLSHLEKMIECSSLKQKKAIFFDRAYRTTNHKEIIQLFLMIKDVELSFSEISLLYDYLVESVNPPRNDPSFFVFDKILVELLLKNLHHCLQKHIAFILAICGSQKISLSASDGGECKSESISHSALLISLSDQLSYALTANRPIERKLRLSTLNFFQSIMNRHKDEDLFYKVVHKFLQYQDVNDPIDQEEYVLMLQVFKAIPIQYHRELFLEVLTNLELESKEIKLMTLERISPLLDYTQKDIVEVLQKIPFSLFLERSITEHSKQRMQMLLRCVFQEKSKIDQKALQILIMKSLEQPLYKHLILDEHIRLIEAHISLFPLELLKFFVLEASVPFPLPLKQEIEVFKSLLFDIEGYDQESDRKNIQGLLKRYPYLWNRLNPENNMGVLRAISVFSDLLEPFVYPELMEETVQEIFNMDLKPSLESLELLLNIYKKNHIRLKPLYSYIFLEKMMKLTNLAGNPSRHINIQLKGLVEKVCEEYPIKLSDDFLVKFIETFPPILGLLSKDQQELSVYAVKKLILQISNPMIAFILTGQFIKHYEKHKQILFVPLLMYYEKPIQQQLVASCEAKQEDMMDPWHKQSEEFFATHRLQRDVFIRICRQQRMDREVLLLSRERCYSDVLPVYWEICFKDCNQPCYLDLLEYSLELMALDTENFRYFSEMVLLIPHINSEDILRLEEKILNYFIRTFYVIMMQKFETEQSIQECLLFLDFVKNLRVSHKNFFDKLASMVLVVFNPISVREDENHCLRNAPENVLKSMAELMAINMGPFQYVTSSVLGGILKLSGYARS